MAIDCLEKNRLEEAQLHLQHARIHASKDEKKLRELDKLKGDMSWINSPDRMGM